MITARVRATLLAALTAVFLAACGESDPPPTSPLAEDPRVGDAPTTVVGVPSVLPTFPASGAPGGAPSGDAEHLAGLAIEALAEWLAVPATTFTEVAVERVEWPNACLGVDRPGFACAEVITPGARITLGTFGGAATYTVHADLDGRLAWAPLMDAERVVAEVFADAGRIVLEPAAGSDEIGNVLAVVPGSRLDIALADLRPGDRVHIAVAPSLQPDAGLAPLVWLVVLRD
ncbi:MAG: hypothetical protein AMXMBFR23_13790 [Chloroflexota bacterium]